MITQTLIEILAANVWPLCFLFIMLLILKQLRDDIRPLFNGIVSGLVVKAQGNATAWAIVLVVATLGSMQELVEVARVNHWPILESVAKVATPFFAGIVAGTRQSPIAPVTPIVIPPTVEASK